MSNMFKDTLMFCDKCGNPTSSNLNQNGDECYLCHQGHFIDSKINHKEAIDAVCQEYGDTPESKILDELLRKKYFYGKLDQQSSQSAISARKQAESPEAIEEANRRWRQQGKESAGPKCPICGSTNLKKLSVFGKVAKVKMFGIFGAGDLGKTYKCEDCGVKF